MDERKQLILNIIIEEHIKSAAPVGSGVVVEKYGLDVSSATVRNEMSWLEHEGWIAQPHTSAGRVPTEAAYHWYLERLKPQKCGSGEKNEIKQALAGSDEDGKKQAAKLLSQKSNSAVFWAMNRRNLYYTGITNLFSQPEFREIEKVFDISAVIDRMDEVIEAVFNDYELGVHTRLGDENPFGNFFATVIGKYKPSGREPGMFGIIGPLRMDYCRNMALAETVVGLIA